MESTTALSWFDFFRRSLYNDVRPRADQRLFMYIPWSETWHISLLRSSDSTIWEAVRRVKLSEEIIYFIFSRVRISLPHQMFG